MNAFLSSFLQPSTAWLLIGVVLVIFEFAIPGLLIIFFGAGAILTGLICWLIPLTLNQQLLLFIVSSVALLLMLRRFLKPILYGSGLESTADEEEFNGQQVRVVEAIQPPASGTVELNGASWRATADVPLASDTLVRVVRRDNLTLHVTPISE